MSTWDSTRGNGLKSQQGRFALSISQNHLSRTVEGRTEVLGEVWRFTGASWLKQLWLRGC